MTRWAWTVEGTAVSESPGAMARAVTDNGEIEAERAGDALHELIYRGPFWDGIDDEDTITITIQPAFQQSFEGKGAHAS